MAGVTPLAKTNTHVVQPADSRSTNPPRLWCVLPFRPFLTVHPHIASRCSTALPVVRLFSGGSGSPRSPLSAFALSLSLSFPSRYPRCCTLCLCSYSEQRHIGGGQRKGWDENVAIESEKGRFDFFCGQQLACSVLIFRSAVVHRRRRHRI